MLGRWLRRARTLFRRGRVKDEIQRELEFHVEMEAAERERRGAGPRPKRIERHSETSAVYRPSAKRCTTCAD